MTKRRRLFVLLGLLAVVAAAYVYAGEVKLTTYYPAPYGEYRRVVARTLGIGDTNNDSKIDGSDAPDPATNSGDVWIKGKVGIGTTSPAAKLDVNGAAVFTSEIDNGAGTAINWTAGNKQVVTISGDVTLGFTNPTGATNLILRVVRGTTAGTTTWPTIKWKGGTAPVLSTTANAVDIVGFYFSGTTYYGAAMTDFK